MLRGQSSGRTKRPTGGGSGADECVYRDLIKRGEEDPTKMSPCRWSVPFVSCTNGQWREGFSGSIM
ncbi:hypothetical protein MUK42_35871 [Musa troglodytarum]|uniref:Uncharacterized protein n=1 Tax=Musa troglodytarum TaxID=320322 RepID=A0A9E7KQW7_9LILI|nr:hypothetical protein MUK42_35871 [Musa troglodytarum]